MYETPIKGSVQILGTIINIVIDDESCEAEEAAGFYRNETIYLRSSYDDLRAYLDTYRHECIHALCEVLGVQLDHHTEEILANTIAKMITYDI